MRSEWNHIYSRELKGKKFKNSRFETKFEEVFNKNW